MNGIIESDPSQEQLAEYEEERWAAVEAGENEDELPFFESSGDEDEDAYYFIRKAQVPGGNIFQASRVGDTERVRYLLQEQADVDVNKRDRWDSTPLYYACLAGHEEVAELLLEAGAVCNEYTFDGDRCHYAALNISIRSLLRRYEARPPPLSPMAASLRAVCSLCTNPEATDETLRPTYEDLVFVLRGERIPLHRCVLAARSPYFRKMLRTAWLPPEDGRIREVHLGSPLLTPQALRALIIYLYSERLDISMEEAVLMQKLVAKVKCRELQQAIGNELYTYKYYFKSTRKGELAPRRFVLQQGALPPEAHLAGQLGSLRHWAAVQEGLANLAPCADDHADVIFRLQDRLFSSPVAEAGMLMRRCQKVILSARSEYFCALLQRSEELLLDPGPGGQPAQLPILDIHDVSPDVFDIVLAFAYTNEVPRLGHKHQSSAAVERLFDAADFFLLFGLKKAVAETVMQDIEQGMRAGATPSLEHLCRLLLSADTHSVQELRYPCLAAVADRFDAIASGAAQQRDVSVFAAFIQAVAPQDAEDIFDGSTILGASGGNIEGSGIGGLGVGTLLQDLREAYLESHGGHGSMRDEVAERFDQQLLKIFEQQRVQLDAG